MITRERVAGLSAHRDSETLLVLLLALAVDARRAREGAEAAASSSLVAGRATGACATARAAGHAPAGWRLGPAQGFGGLGGGNGDAALGCRLCRLVEHLKQVGRGAREGGRVRRASLMRVAHKAIGLEALLVAAAGRAAAARARVAVLEDDMLGGQRDHEAAADVGPVGGPEKKVVDDDVAAHIARPDEAHVARARATAEGEARWQVRQCVAHDGHALALEVGGRVACDHGEARGLGWKRRGAGGPYGALDVGAARAVGGDHGLDLHRAAVDAKLEAAIVKRLAAGVNRREALRALERDGAWVLFKVLALGRAKELDAVLDKEAVELGVERVEAGPGALVELDRERQLVGVLDGGERGALHGHVHGESLERVVAGRDELVRGLVGHRVDVADAVAGLHELEADVVAPVARQRLDGATSRVTHFFRCMTAVGQMTRNVTVG